MFDHPVSPSPPGKPSGRLRTLCGCALAWVAVAVPAPAALDLCRHDESTPDLRARGSAPPATEVQPAEWKIGGSDTRIGDSFGRAVAIHGDRAAVAAPGHDLDGVRSVGAVYLFERDPGGGEWHETAKLLPDDPEKQAFFGSAVAVGDDVVAVSAPFADDLGVVYLFELDPAGSGTWRQTARLTGIEAGVYKELGLQLAIDGDTLVIAAGGSAYVHGRNAGGPGAWGEIAEVTPLDGQPTDYFGWAIAVSGDRLAVGAPCNDETGNETGAVYLFERDFGGADRWLQTAKLVDLGLPDFAELGWSLALEGDTLVAGAVEVVRVYERDDGHPDGWRETAQVAIDSVSDYFGENVSLEGDRLAVSAYKDDEGAYNSGAVYLFERDAGGPGTWGQIARLKQSDPVSGAGMGNSVELSGGVVLAGAPSNADPDIIGTRPGAAYLFQIDPLLVVTGACPGSATLELDGVTGGSPVVLVAGEPGDAVVPSGPCAGVPLALASPRPLLRLRADEAGSLHLPIDLPVAACGVRLQAVELAGCRTSNAARLP